MANTPYSDINDLFLQQVEDYRLVELYNNGAGADNLNTYLLGFMILAIPEFSSCTQDLSDRNDTNKSFNYAMTEENQKILSTNN